MSGFLLRWCAAIVLVFATYNPTQWNFVQWSFSAYQTQLSVVVLLGLVLTIAYIIYLRATFRSIGAVGIALVVALIAAIIWVLVDNGILSLENSTFLTWIGLLGLSFVLGIGLSWSHVRRALSGQSDVDDVDE